MHVSHVLPASGLTSSFVVDEPNLIAGMLAGADSIDDMDLLRHGGTTKIFTELRAPSTLGTFLRTFTHGHVRQVDAVNSRLLVNPRTTRAQTGQPLLPDTSDLVYLDVDDTNLARPRARVGHARRMITQPHSSKPKSRGIITASSR